MMKNQMKIIKQWLAAILTGLVMVTLFGIIFIKTDLVTPTPTFFLELGAVLGLTLMMKMFWYDYAEDKRLSEQDIKDEKDKYYKIVDDNVEDSNDLEKYLIILNQENKDRFVSNKIGCRTPKNLAKKNWWICFWHPSYRKLSENEIGFIRYNKIYFRCMRKADKLRPIKSEEIMALSDSNVLYDSKNHLNEKKRAYQIVTTIISFVFTTVLACMALKEIMMNWENAFRYVGYVCAMVWAIASTIVKAYKQTGDETFDYLSRLKFIVDKYATHKEKEALANGKLSCSDGVGLSDTVERV